VNNSFVLFFSSNKLFKKICSILCNFSLLLNIVLPYFAAVPVYAATPSPVSISYALSDSKLNFSPNTLGDVPYQLFYKTDSKIDSVVGSKLPSFIYLGSCSNGDCLSQNFDSAVLKIKTDSSFYYYYLTLKNNQLNIVKEGDSSQFDLTNEENNFLSPWTFENVKLNKEYENSGVKLTFTELPENSGNIKIQEITLTPEQIEQTGALSDKAYDITSDMSDGTFEYNLSLPIPESSKGKDVDIKFTEDISQIDSAQTVDNTINSTPTSVSVTNLNHFTIFVVTNPNSQVNCDIVIAGTTFNTTCFPTIQQAINVALNNSIIYIAGGTYPEYLSINNKSVSLIGSSSSPTIIKPTTGGAVITLDSITGPMTIEGLTIDADNSSGRGGIYIQNGSSKVTVKNNKILNFRENGILISNSNHNSVENNVLTGSSIGSNSGIYMDNNAEGNTIDNNTITLVTSGTGNLYDIYFTGTITKNNTVKNNTINGGTRAFQQDGGISGTVTFSDNNIGNITGPSFAGVYLNGGSAIISGNTIKNSVRPIEFWGVANITISNNTINGSTYDGINAGSYSTVLINNNTFTNVNQALNNRQASNEINAENNNWGVAGCQAIQNKITGSVDYLPYIYDGVNYSSCTPVNGTLTISPNISNTISIPSLRPDIHAIGTVNNLYSGATLKRAIWNTDINQWVRNWETVTVNNGTFDQILPTSSCQRDDNICPTDTYGRPFPAGNYKTVFQAYDGSVVVGVVGTQYFTIDNSPPTTPVLTWPIKGTFTNDNTPLMQWNDSTDIGGSGIAGYYYRIYYNCSNVNDSSTCSSVYPNSTGLWLVPSQYQAGGTNDGTYYWQVRAQDKAGNQSGWSGLEKVAIDTAAPTSSLLFQGDLDETKNITTNNRWFESFDNIDLKINVGDQSTDKINYQIVDGDVPCPAQSSSSYTAVAHNTNLASLVNAKIDGIYSLCYFASDLAGNKESTTHKELLKKDNTNPSFTIDSMSGNLLNGIYYNSSDINAQITINDADSGYSHTRYDLYNADVNHNCTTLIGTNQDKTVSTTNPTTITLSKTGLADGNYCLRVWVYDKVQNKGWTDTSGYNGWVKFVIDNTAPNSTINGGADNEKVYLSSWDGFLAGTATDNLSGVSKVELSIKNSANEYWTGSTWQVGSTFVTATGTTSWIYQIGATLTDGTYTIKSHAIDNAGNTENSYTITIVLDKTIPEVNISLNPIDPDASNGWYKTQPTVTLTQTDDNFDRIEYQWDSQSGNWTTYSNPFKPASEGAHVLYYRAIDKANNISTVGVKNIAWDQTDLEYGPQNISANPNPTSGSTSKIKWEIAKDNTGIDKYEVQWKLNDTTNPPSFSKTVGAGTTEVEIDQLTEGRWTVKVVAFDTSGKSKDNSIDVVVDRSGPTAPILNLTGTSAGTATLSWNAVSDAKDYIIWYGNAPGTRLYGARVGNVTSYTVRELGAGNYYFIVRAVDEAQNQSADSNEVNTGTIAGAPNVEPNTPAEGFTPEVLGTDTGKLTTPTPSPAVSVSDVLGISVENRPQWYWFCLLLLIPVSLLLRRLFKRNQNN